LCLIFHISNLSFAQEFLVLEKMGTKKRYEYHFDDQIIFRIRGEDYFNKDVILALTDSSIIFSGGSLEFAEIEQIKPPVKAWMVTSGGTLIVAGIGYYLIDQFNQLYMGNGLSNDPGVMRTSIVLTGVGAGLILMSKKKVKVIKNWRLRHVNIY